MKVKKKLVGGLKIVFTFFVFFVYTKNIYCSEILDYETEKFIYEILDDIININKINKIIKLKINNSDEINAFVDYQNTIHINSGLIQNSKDYVALLSVLAHEVGHIDMNHISLRKKSIENTKKFNSLSLFSILAGTAITQSPELFQSSILSSAILSKQYIEFSKEQEMEADLYAIKTLKLLNTNSDSIIELLKKIEKNLLEKGFTEDNQRISTHPYFADRILLIKNLSNNKKNNFNIYYDTRFNYIKAKFVGHSNNNNILNDLEEPYKTYAKSIKNARNGNLRMSLESLNKLINNNNNNSFFLETKADILYANGYTKEAVKFYKKNLEKHPENFYAKIRIFENTNTKNLSNKEIKIIFDKNKQLLLEYYNNKNILNKYLTISKQLNKIEWIDFLKFYLSVNNMKREDFISKINTFKITEDKDLSKLISSINKNS